ncbi:unnamed protein product [Arabidopsis lyrata]|nr:unnamed protein product [Arabidopsis lyrata]
MIAIYIVCCRTSLVSVVSNGFLKVITAVAFALENVDDDDGCVDEVWKWTRTLYSCQT